MAAPKTERIYLTEAEKERLLRVPIPEPLTPESLLAFRQRHRLRVVDLARLLDVDQLTITRIERARPSYIARQFTLHYATALALALCELERRIRETT
jgi:DNA-binding XRE family transcriptional regulator